MLYFDILTIKHLNIQLHRAGTKGSHLSCHLTMIINMKTIYLSRCSVGKLCYHAERSHVRHPCCAHRWGFSLPLWLRKPSRLHTPLWLGLSLRLYVSVSSTATDAPAMKIAHLAGITPIAADFCCGYDNWLGSARRYRARKILHKAVGARHVWSFHLLNDKLRALNVAKIA